MSIPPEELRRVRILELRHQLTELDKTRRDWKDSMTLYVAPRRAQRRAAILRELEQLDAEGA